MDNKSVSLITVCYNAEKTIKDTINSVLSQHYTNFEYIVIDGGSTDSTLRILSESESLFKAKAVDFIWISEKDNGLYDAMNKGIEVAKKTWIWFINSDDYLEEDIISNIFSKPNFDFQKYDGMYGKVTRLGKIVSYIVGRRNLDDSTYSVNFNHSSTLVKRKVFDEYGAFNTEFRYSADYDMFTRFVHKGRIAFKYIDINLSYMRDGGTSDRLINYFQRGKEHFVIDRNFYGLYKATVKSIRFYTIDLLKKILKSALIFLNSPRLLRKFYKHKYELIEN